MRGSKVHSSLLISITTIVQNLLIRDLLLELKYFVSFHFSSFFIQWGLHLPLRRYLPETGSSISILQIWGSVVKPIGE